MCASDFNLVGFTVERFSALWCCCSLFHCRIESRVKEFKPYLLVLTIEGFKRPIIFPLVPNECCILSKFSVSRQSVGKFRFRCWWTRRIFRTSTRSKTLSSLSSAKIGEDGDLGLLKVISLKAVFWRVKILWVTELSHSPQSWLAYRIWEPKIPW